MRRSRSFRRRMRGASTKAGIGRGQVAGLLGKESPIVVNVWSRSSPSRLAISTGLGDRPRPCESSSRATAIRPHSGAFHVRARTMPRPCETAAAVRTASTDEPHARSYNDDGDMRTASSSHTAVTSAHCALRNRTTNGSAAQRVRISSRPGRPRRGSLSRNPVTCSSLSRVGRPPRNQPTKVGLNRTRPGSRLT